jgi:hypothetical protein
VNLRGPIIPAIETKDAILFKSLPSAQFLVATSVYIAYNFKVSTVGFEKKGQVPRASKPSSLG